MKHFKMTVSAMIALPLALTACSGGDVKTEPKDGKAAVTKGPVQFTILQRGDSWDPDNAYLPMMEQATNTKMMFQQIPGTEYENKRNVVMASGDYPNVIRVRGTEALYQKYLQDSLLLPLDDYINKYPSVKNAYPKEVWDANRNPKDGKIYLLPRITGLLPTTISYRKDWLEQLGMAEPKTTDEYKTMLKAFKDKNPGKVKDLIPFTPNNNQISWVSPFLSAFGSDYMAWQPSKDNPKRLVLSNTLPEYKEGLLYVRDLRKEGLMDTEWMVGKSRGLFKFYGSQSGSSTDWPQYIDLRTEAIRQVDPKGKVGYITSLKGPKGVQSGHVVTPNEQDLGTAITKSTTPEQMEAIFRVINWQLTDGYDLLKYGVEGKTYDVVNGQKVRRGRDAVLKDNPKYDLYMLDRIPLIEPPRNFEFNKENFGQIPADDFAYSSQVLKDAESKVHKNYMVLGDDPVINDNLNKIKSAVDEVASKIILDPNTDADKAFAEFLDKLKQNKIDEVTEAVNKLNPVK
ncbi:extracellular solute-binding protein [Paenibacillus thalictri]|uniref:Extracellular solute-binding protein n=1 Tax=Paenibacillus thalictri TaxID=2527873 RepID=A0A4Q9DNB2_9BACL|nr:extracellular solute-binding protein [Paenibacillus thalictri]TBL76354.1 extracellular solute-binding protein [Paenibacillus thalictri]